MNKEDFTKILLLSENYRTPLGGPVETDMSNRRPLRDHHAWSETDMPVGSQIRHVGLRSGMSVFDDTFQSLVRHVDLRWDSDEASFVFEEACWSQILHVSLQ